MPPGPPENQTARVHMLVIWERRTDYRSGCPVDMTARVLALPERRRLFGRVLNASPSGVALQLPEPIEVGARLLVLLGPNGYDNTGMRRAEVRHCTAQELAWVVGCRLTEPLEPTELAWLVGHGRTPEVLA